MTEFAYNNVKNASISYIPFKLNNGYYSHVFFKREINPQLKFCLVNKLANEPKKLIAIS